MGDAYVLDPERSLEPLKLLERRRRWGEVPVGCVGEAVRFEDVEMGVPCPWRDSSIHFGVRKSF